jgi:hypothetical protein
VNLTPKLQQASWLKQKKKNVFFPRNSGGNEKKPQIDTYHKHLSEYLIGISVKRKHGDPSSLVKGNI